MRLVCVIALIAGCGFDSPEPSYGGGSFVPLHVPAGGRAPGDGDLTLTQPVDTDALTIGGSQALPSGVVFDAWPQPGGVELAVLHVRSLRVPSDATVRVLGTRALVVVASEEIDIDGVLDGAARRDQPGPGGAGPAAGMGAGRAGTHAGNFLDTGGSGGGFAGSGGVGGSAGGSGCSTLPGPMGGASYGAPNLAVLLAGSGGGVAFATSNCGTRAPGAGGGAIQLSSATRVRVNGGLNAGGGGGGGGRAQSGGSQCNMSAGAGGGSGGAIVLQSPLVEVGGTLAANGGGGGSAGGDFDGNDDPPESDGEDGQDGLLSATPAAGGRDVGVWSSAGGPGGTTGGGGPGASDSNCAANGGGGGGAAGRIVLALPPSLAPNLSGVSSPAGVQTTY